MTDPIISVQRLTKKYGGFTAVDDLSFTVTKGSIFGLLGPNGAGKTTTLEIMETLREKSSGTVTIGGFSLHTHPAEIKKIIGVQLQAAGFYPNLNLRQILELFGGLYNCPVDPLELLEKVNLSEKASSQFKHLSGGQKQRFSIATTLVNKPQIIFLDEPTTGLDPQARRNLWELIRQLRENGSTVVLTTHYMDEAEVLCDQVVIIEHGQIIAEGSPDQLIDDLLSEGFRREKTPKAANLEDVFLYRTGRRWRND